MQMSEAVQLAKQAKDWFEQGYKKFPDCGEGLILYSMVSGLCYQYSIPNMYMVIPKTVTPSCFGMVMYANQKYSVNLELS